MHICYPFSLCTSKNLLIRIHIKLFCIILSAKYNNFKNGEILSGLHSLLSKKLIERVIGVFFFIPRPKLLYKIYLRFLDDCVQNTWNFVFEIWEMVKKIKLDIDRLFLVWKMKRSSILVKYVYREHFFNYQNQKQFICVRFYFLYLFLNLKNKILCILDTIM